MILARGKKRRILLPLTLALTTSMVSACGSQSGTTGGSSASPSSSTTSTASTTSAIGKDPIKLSLYNAVGMDDKAINNLIIGALQKKYPNLTVEYIKSGSGGQTLQQLVTAGNVPDIVLGFAGFETNMKNFDLNYDLTPMIKKYNFDLSRFQDGVVDSAKNYSGNGEIHFLPWFNNRASLYYNKDIFDKFGVAYPKDGMKWSDLVDLTRKLTRTDGTQKYFGLQMNQNFLISVNQLSLPIVDAKTEKASVNNDGWKQFFQTFKDIYDVPGMRVDKKDPVQPDWNARNVAMYAYNNSFGGLIQMYDEGKPMNWDLVTLPEFPQAPGVGTQLTGSALFISSTSKNKDAAFEAISYLFSDDVLMSFAKSQSIPVFKDPKFQQSFGDVPAIKGKNTASLFKQKIAPTPPFTDYTTAAQSILIAQFTAAVIDGTTDINSALRVADENINKKIADIKASKK